MSRSKASRYRRIRDQLAAELLETDDPIARMATIVALLHHKQPRFFWTGFYRLIECGDLVVGPYQGTLACQVLPAGQGVCGTAVTRGETLIVPDVHVFPGQIACEGRANSEIVVPVRDPSGAIVGVLDVDSTEPGCFDDVDAEWLETIVAGVYGAQDA